MTYGDGSDFKSLEALDVAGHEMSHGVCANAADLTYSGEPGGLNEANSDIFGTMAEFYAKGGGFASASTTIPATGGNWTIGEQLETSSFPTPLRYMYKPSKDGASPDAWSSSIGSKDVHYSSGPMNRAFYFLSQGASATSGDYYTSYLPSGMTGVGNDHAARIWYRALTVYLTSSSNYAAARTAAINAAKDLYGAGSPEEIAVWNAFRGINVGAAWSGGSSSNTVTATITTPSANQTVASGTSVSFSGSATDSSSSATLTYAWNFGDGSTATGASASHTFTNTGSANVTYTVTFTATDSTGAKGTATRTVTVTPAASGSTTFNEVESNNSTGTANVLGTSVTQVVGYVGTTTDNDYFKITVPSGRTLTVNMTGPAKDYDLYLLSSSGSTLKSSTGSTATETVSYKNSGSTTATYYIRVKGYSSAYSTTSPYTLAISR
jgi:hypothetical protein